MASNRNESRHPVLAALEQGSCESRARSTPILLAFSFVSRIVLVWARSTPILLAFSCRASGAEYPHTPRHHAAAPAQFMTYGSL